MDSRIRIFPGYLHALETFISNLHHSFSIITISETRFSDATIDTYQMEGYAHEYHEIDAEVCFLYLWEITQKGFDPVQSFNWMFFIELQSTDSSRSNSAIIAVIYRTRNTNIGHFYDVFSTLLDKVKMENKQVYSSGDYNINLINTDKHQPSA